MAAAKQKPKKERKPIDASLKREAITSVLGNQVLLILELEAKVNALEKRVDELEAGDA